MHNLLQSIYSSPASYVSMSEAFFTDLSGYLFEKFNQTCAYLDNQIGVVNNIVRGLTGVDLNSIPVERVLSVYQELGPVITTLDALANHLNFVLDMVQDTCNNYDGLFFSEFVDSFRSINEKSNMYIDRVRSLIVIYRRIENGLYLKGLINEITPVFPSESGGM